MSAVKNPTHSNPLQLLTPINGTAPPPLDMFSSIHLSNTLQTPKKNIKDSGMTDNLLSYSDSLFADQGQQSNRSYQKDQFLNPWDKHQLLLEESVNFTENRRATSAHVTSKNNPRKYRFVEQEPNRSFQLRQKANFVKINYELPITNAFGNNGVLYAPIYMDVKDVLERKKHLEDIEGRKRRPLSENLANKLRIKDRRDANRTRQGISTVAFKRHVDMNTSTLKKTWQKESNMEVNR